MSAVYINFGYTYSQRILLLAAVIFICISSQPAFIDVGFYT
jgi:hypothetical protein